MSSSSSTRASRKNGSTRRSRSSRRQSRRSSKMRADAVVQRAQDEVTLLTARFDVRRAELDVQGSVLSSAIDKQKFVLTLEEAKGAARAAPERPEVARRQRSRVAGGARGEAQQSQAPDGQRAAQHRQHDAARAVRRSGRGEGQRHEQRRVGRRGRAGIPRRRHRVSQGGRSPRCCTSRASSSSPR